MVMVMVMVVALIMIVAMITVFMPDLSRVAIPG
jgi:hypothetical protein